MTVSNPHVLIVESRYYDEIAAELLYGATAALEEDGASFDRIEVPGAFEIPAAVRIAFAAHRYDGYVTLGCVIRGETTHYDYVCGESARGLQDLAVRHGLAIGYGILTCENRDQAWVRADRQQGDKGGVAVRACLSMIALRRKFDIAR
jgi:6,7-dimethyl-8-ribityllumazine synthase